MFKRNRQPTEIPSATSTRASRDAEYDAIVANADAEAREIANRLTGPINEALRTGKDPRMPRIRGVNYQILVVSRVVSVAFYGYFGGRRVEAYLRQRYEGHGYIITGQENKNEPGYHRIFIKP